MELLVGIPANPKRDHHWVKRKSTKRVFCQEMFSSMPRFFLHHQIDLAQRDGKKILLSMITAVSRLLCLDFDFPENYTHINQVVICLEHILPSTLSLLTPTKDVILTLFSIRQHLDYEPNGLV